MENIRQNLERIEELSADELSALKESILSEYKAVKDNELDSETVAVLKELASASNAVVAEFQRRDAEKAELSAAAEEAGASIAALETPEKSEEEEDPAEAEAAVTEEEDEEEIDPETGEPVKKKDSEDEVFSESVVTDIADEPVSELAGDETPQEISPVEEEAEAAVETPEEAEAAVEVPVEAEAAVETPEETEVSEEAEAAVEETPAQEDSVVVEASEETIELTTNERDSEDTTVTASIESNESLEIEVPEANRPQTNAVKASVTITAGADIPGVTAGSPIHDLSGVAQALIDRRKAMGRTSGGDGEQHTVAVFNTTYPESRVLSSSDADANFDKIREVTSIEAITAAGGLLAPVETSYDLYGLEENLGRPVKDSLAVFNADRGGIRYLAPVQLSDLDGAASLWTLEDDIAALITTGDYADVAALVAAGYNIPTGYTVPTGIANSDGNAQKPCIRVESKGVLEAYTDAIPLCLTFGNIGARTFPELVEKHVKLGLMWHARYAEQRLITRIAALSTAVSTTAELGIGRDLLVAVNKAAAGYRNRHRMGEDAPLRVIFPYWLKDAIRSDFTKQIPGDGVESSIGLTEAAFTSWLNSYGIQITWAFDGESDQYFAAQENGALVDFPADLKWYLFAEGTFLFLDGGTLDLGIVRDSTLNATNDYKMFLETFEGLAKVGVESLAITTPVNLWGATAGTVDTTA